MRVYKPRHEIREGRISATFRETTSWAHGRYCFTVNAIYDEREPLKWVCHFYLDDIERMEKVLCEARSWLTERAAQAKEVA